MTNRELLELSAKAIGLVGYWVEGFGFRVEDERGMHSFWNPLADDGEALRLAVKLEINILLSMEECSARNPYYTRWMNEACKTEPYAAIRRAIVRAAAEIGKGLDK